MINKDHIIESKVRTIDHYEIGLKLKHLWNTRFTHRDSIMIPNYPKPLESRTNSKQKQKN